MDQPSAVAFAAFADAWPRVTQNGDRRRPMRHWARERTFFLHTQISFLAFSNFRSKLNDINTVGV